MKKSFLRYLCIIFTAIFLLAPTLSVFSAEPPRTDHSHASLVYCAEPNKILHSVNADGLVYPAALTKLMTAVLVTEAAERGDISLDSYITVKKSVIEDATGNSMKLQVGEEIKLRDLMIGMILQGANDAALVLADAVSGSVSSFVDAMNVRAKELGMEKTVYTNPTGLHNDKMVTTVSELLLLTIHANKLIFINETCALEHATVPATNTSKERYFGTRNYLISTRVNGDYYLPMARGMICGSTYEAGFCIIATAQRDGLNYISIVMGGDTSEVVTKEEVTEINENGETVIVSPAEYKYVINGYLEAAKLLTWADDNYGYIRAVDSSTPICQIPVKLGEAVDHVTLLPESHIELYVPLDIDREKDISISWTLDEESLTAPVRSGTRVGTLTATYLGEKIGEVPLIVKTNVAKSGGLTILNRAKQLMGTPFFIIMISVIAVGAVIYVFATAISRSRKKAAARREFIKKNRYLNSGK